MQNQACKVELLLWLWNCPPVYPCSHSSAYECVFVREKSITVSILVSLCAVNALGIGHAVVVPVGV